MISIIFCSRATGNDASNLKRLLDSTVEHTTPEEREKIEFLIKYDDDDVERPPDSFFDSYPFPIRRFTWSRGEGRHYLHHAQEYMFAQRDLRSRFCLMMSDDFYFFRSGFVSEILAVKDEFCIIGHSRPAIEVFAGIYEQEQAIRTWVVAFGDLAPVISTRLIEVCQNFGWQANVDSWVMGLSVVLYDLYGIIIWRAMPSFYERGGGYGLGDTPTYNNMELTCQKGPFNKYWFELVRRQARNVYLNMEYGSDLSRGPSRARRLWKKARAQPLYRLPYRLCRRVLRELGQAMASVSASRQVQPTSLDTTLSRQRSVDSMTQLGLRERVPFPESYKDFYLIRTHGRIYGIPDYLDPEELGKTGRLFTHAGIQSVATLEEMRELLDRLEPHWSRQQLVGEYEGYYLFHYQDSLYGVPKQAGTIDLGVETDRRRPGVVVGRTKEEVEERIRAVEGAVPIEFAGWLPIYEFSGNCGQHPQFKHVADPPPGYRFTSSAPPRVPKSRWQKFRDKVSQKIDGFKNNLSAMIRPFFAFFRGGSGVGPVTRLRVLRSMLRMMFALWRQGARLVPTLRFLQTRHLQSQILLGKCSDLVFLTSMPYTFGQNPWVIEIEDPTTLFYPLIQNGRTTDLRLAESPYFPIVKTLLESDQCKGIITHMKSTARMVPTLFGSEKITNKVHYVPLGIQAPVRFQRHEVDEPEHIHLLFINSWCQVPANFYVRGGLDVLEAFATLHERYPQLRLTLRSSIPGLDAHYHRILEAGWVRVIERYMPADEMSELLAGSHIFLLPAARVHILSLLQAMSYGLNVVTSDGWGIEEYVTHERNGLIVKGRYGKTSWADYEAGCLREDYDYTHTADPTVVEGLIEAVSRLVEDSALRRRLGRTAREDVQSTYTLEGWNRGLKNVFDEILLPGQVVVHDEVREPELAVR